MKAIIPKIKYEDPKLLDHLDKAIKLKRKTVFKMPKPGSQVIVLFSGGLDSIITADILIRQYHLKLFPLFINWGQMNLKQELKAVRYYEKYFQNKYRGKFANVKKITSNIPPASLSKKVKDIVVLRNMTLAIYAVQYAKQLEDNGQMKIRTIFCSSVAGDGKAVPDSTLTAIRSVNLAICINEFDFTWQYTSLALEREIGNYLDKSDLVVYANSVKFPYEKTWSCYQNSRYHCGKCMPCVGRQNAFIKAKLVDPTLYQNQKIISKIARKFKQALFS